MQEPEAQAAEIGADCACLLPLPLCARIGKHYHLPMGSMIESWNLPPGTVADSRYEVLRLIKAGGMGAVYAVADRVLKDRVYALKQMIDPSASLGERQAAIDRFLSEIQVMQTLNHPSIPRVYSSFVHENSFCFVMDLVEGDDLAQVLKNSGTPGLDPHSVVGWSLQVLDALEYLHGRQTPVTHRDIKPSNLLLRNRDGRIVLIDFGIARVTNPAEGFWIGTPGYAPAEQQQGNPEPRSDLYALGATMHELLSGRKPVDFDFPTFEDLGVSVPRPLAQLVFRALGTWPEERFPDARTMSRRLRELPGFDISLPAVDREHDFETAVLDLKQRILDPILQNLMHYYSNECHTPYLPRNLDFLEFTLAAPTPFVLQVVKDPAREALHFYEKQGLLEPIPIGDVRPLDAASAAAVPKIVQRFVEDYEGFKGASWQIM